MLSKVQLTQRLERAQTKLNRLENYSYATDRISEHFHLGTVGGSGKNTAKLNRQRERDLDRVIDNAKEIVRLHQYISDLEWRIKRIDTPKPVKSQRKPKQKTPPQSIQRLGFDIPFDDTYLEWANALMEDTESYITVLKSKFHAVQWDDPHDHYLRGEQAAYITVQTVLMGAYMRGSKTNTEAIFEELEIAKTKSLKELASNPKSRYLPQYCEGLKAGIKAIMEAL